MTAIPYDRLYQPVVLGNSDRQDVNDLIMLASEFKLHEDDKRLTEVSMTMRVPDFGFAKNGFDFLADPRIQHGANWEFRFGYFRMLSEPVAVVVTTFEPDFSDSGELKLLLKFNSKGAHMTRDSQSRNWGTVATSDIASQLARTYGFETDIEASNDRRRQPYVQAVNVTDLEYLQRLAAAINWVCYVDGNKLHYHPPRTDAPPVFGFTWMGGDPNSILQSFKPTIKEPRARRSARHSEGDGTNGSTTSTSNEGGHEQAHMGSTVRHNVNVRNRTHGSTDQDRANAHRVQVITSAAQRAADLVNSLRNGNASNGEPSAEQDSHQRQRHAHADQRRTLETANEAKLNCIGVPVVRRGKNVNVRGVGVELGGNWYVKATTHTINASGYKTEADVKRGGNNNGAAHNGSTETATGTANNHNPEETPNAGPRAVHVNVRSRRVVDANGRVVNR